LRWAIFSLSAELIGAAFEERGRLDIVRERVVHGEEDAVGAEHFHGAKQWRSAAARSSD